MAKNLIFGPDFWLVWRKFGPQKFFVGFITIIYWTLLQALHCMQFKRSYWTKLKKMSKIWFRAQFWRVWPKFGPPFYFFESMASSITRCHGQLSSCTIPEKTNNPKFRDRWTNGQTDRQTKNNDFIVRCPTNVERPIEKSAYLSIVFLYVSHFRY